MPVEDRETRRPLNIERDWREDFTDEGCQYFSSCLNCPLVRCHHDFEKQGSRSIDRAIEQTWATGQHRPEFLDIYSGQRPPAWVLGSGYASGSNVHSRNAEIMRLAELGYSHQRIAIAVGLSRQAVWAVVRKCKTQAAS